MIHYAEHARCLPRIISILLSRLTRIYLLHSLARVPSESSLRRRDARRRRVTSPDGIAGGLSFPVAIVARTAVELSSSVARGLMILLLVLLLVNCASSPTLTTKRKGLSSPRHSGSSASRYRIAFYASHRRTLTTRRCHYQLPARDSVFYAADPTRCTLEMPRAYLQVYADADGADAL